MKNIIIDYAKPVIAFSFFVILTIAIIKLFLPSIRSSIPFLSGNLSNITQAVVLFWTGIALVIYTYETKRLRDAAHRQVEVSNEQIRVTQYQTETQQRPFVITETSYDISTQVYKVRVKNVGNGTAINIKILDAEAIYPEHRMIYHFDEIVTVLYSKEDCNISCMPEKQVNGERISWQTSFPDLYPPAAQTSIVVRIEFQNVEGKSYFVEETISRNKFEITRFGSL